jgi:hypothetical protein
MKKEAARISLILLTTLPAFAQVAVPTTTSISFQPSGSFVEQFSPSAAVGQSTSEFGPVPGGVQYLDLMLDASGKPTSCAGAVPGAGSSALPIPVNTKGSVSFVLDTSQKGTFGYQIRYSGYIDATYAYKGSASPCVDFTVGAAPCSGVSLGVREGHGHGGPPVAGSTHTWSLTLTVNACENASKLKVQGGANGWAENSIGEVRIGEITLKPAGKNNVVTTWTIDELLAGEGASLRILVTGTIKPGTPPGTILGLLGPWSVSYNTASGPKSASLGAVTVTVE